MWRSTLTFINARVVTPTGIAPSVRIAGHVLGVGEAPARHDIVIDLDGAWVLPGLINAHEHLELNHYGRRKFRDRYDDVSEWVDDMRPRLQGEPEIRRAQQHRLAHRLFIGGLKNLLAGVTTIAHHNPVYREIGRFCASRVVRDFGWAHSLGMEHQPVGARGETGGVVVERHRATPADCPFIVHVAEGVDDRAAEEFERFRMLGCLTANAVLVHGVGIDREGLAAMAEAGAGLVWCPASNTFLFGRTADVRAALDDPRLASRVALGSDSRLSGARDLIDEMKVARDAAAVTPAELLHMVTTGPAAVLGLRHAGRIATGQPADLVVVPNLAPTPAEALLAASRRDLRLVMVGGRPLVGDGALAHVFRERRVSTRRIEVDGAAKIIDVSIARMLAGHPIGEPGVLCDDRAAPRRYAFARTIAE